MQLNGKKLLQVVFKTSISFQASESFERNRVLSNNTRHQLISKQPFQLYQSQCYHKVCMQAVLSFSLCILQNLPQVSNTSNKEKNTTQFIVFLLIFCSLLLRPLLDAEQPTGSQIKHWIRATVENKVTVSELQELERRIRKDESGKSGRKVAFTFDYIFYYILYASRKFYIKIQFCHSCPAAYQSLKINGGFGRTDIILQDILDHHTTF